MEVWVEHRTLARWEDDGCSIDIPCVICGNEEDGVYTDDGTDEQTSENPNGDEFDACYSHLNPVCSSRCKDELRVRRHPGLAVEEGL